MKKLIVLSFILTGVLLSYYNKDALKLATKLKSRSIASNHSIDPKFEDLLSKKSRTIDHLRSCFESRSCGFSKTDSRAYDLNLAQAIKRELNHLYEFVLENEIEDDRISSLARGYLKISDGHVKEAALMLLSTQKPSSENLESILEQTISYHSAPLVELAMIELSKYKTSEWQERIDNNFIENLKTGSVIVRQVLAKNIATFLNEENRLKYKSFIKNYTSDSKVRKFILASLED
ncbi:hypothetical protein [Halobacteriovorax sp. HLS]|uniref:hypothetical protein n=1 Tax=Halobacteriovorax sp. HLS TaxID=2234000 RepID=UPI000FDB6A93|nr:hypothetical protein [Halobacteriovorax sp. HLS]